MTRQAFVRVLLSLLLLISQQMASSHVMSHLAGNADAGAALFQGDDGGLAKAVAQDQTCSQCLAFAQLSGPLASTPPAFVIPRQRPLPVDHVGTPDVRAGIIVAFQPRAPPFPS